MKAEPIYLRTIDARDVDVVNDVVEALVDELIVSVTIDFADDPDREAIPKAPDEGTVTESQLLLTDLPTSWAILTAHARVPRIVVGPFVVRVTACKYDCQSSFRGPVDAALDTAV